MCLLDHSDTPTEYRTSNCIEEEEEEEEEKKKKKKNRASQKIVLVYIQGASRL